MATWNDLAELMFPDVKETIADLQNKFPARTWTCTRFAPSPTWYLHIWWLFSCFSAWRFAKQTNGTMILRVEDTDQKRLIEWWISVLLNALKNFWISFDEWNLGENWEDVWNYGPYTQSQRKYFYRVFVKELVAKWLAYPCWMSTDEIEKIREQQELAKIMPGIYGNYSIYRNKTVDELIQMVKENSDYIVRFRSHGDTNKKIVFEDILRWKVSMWDNFLDIILLKSDGLPTYHLAHITDDTLMWVTHIIRAEEWLTSVPLHLQLFQAFDLPAPKYCHLAQILKVDDETGKKRKISKRKDPEANVEYLLENWFAVQWILDYLYTIMDSWFEEWQKVNLDKTFLDREFVLENMNKSWALIDLVKMEQINNLYLSRISTDQLLKEWLTRAEKYDTDLADLIKSDVDYAKSALNIERHTEKDPKRFYTFKDIDTQLRFSFDSEREKLVKNGELRAKSEDGKINWFGDFDMNVMKNFIDEYISVLNFDMTVEEWFDQLKQTGKKYGFAANNAEFKEWWYIWKVWDLAMFLRLALCASKRTPDLFSVMKVMWKDRVENRLKLVIKYE